MENYYDFATVSHFVTQVASFYEKELNRPIEVNEIGVARCDLGDRSLGDLYNDRLVYRNKKLFNNMRSANKLLIVPFVIDPFGEQKIGGRAELCNGYGVVALTSRQLPGYVRPHMMRSYIGHELGHLLGAGHDVEPNSLMNTAIGTYTYNGGPYYLSDKSKKEIQSCLGNP